MKDFRQKLSGSLNLQSLKTSSHETINGLLHVRLYIYIYIQREREIYHCHYPVSDYHSNELSNVKTLHERKLCSRSRTSEHFFVSVYHVYSVSIDSLLMWICVKYSILYKGDYLGFTICACYSWEMALNVRLDASFDNT
jgi:hypothetical protein